MEEYSENKIGIEIFENEMFMEDELITETLMEN
jgi:hypothetical protein